MMFKKGLLLAMAFTITWTASGQSIHITIPRRSELTPVQQLNRKGVDEVVKHRYDQAEALFAKAYLFDPADPFTLNNLGYISELRGEVDRAASYYKLASEQGCYAVVDRSNERALKGKPMMDALGTIKNMPMRINRVNIYGIQLLSQNRPFEAETLLKQILPLDPGNPFTLNNLGVAEEATGNYEDALRYYDESANTHSMLPVVVTLKRSSRGMPISELAAEAAADLRKRTKKMDPRQMRAGMLAIRGVSAISQNDWTTARQDFMNAYSLDPQSAFALNNVGYIAEKDGDLETAMSYYARARRASDADMTVGLSTRSDAHGKRLAEVAYQSFRDVKIVLPTQGHLHPSSDPIELLHHDPQPGPSALPAINSPTVN